jgi:S-DNA-T family DNA segregation ATPase FtsK/SpoIIIE
LFQKGPEEMKLLMIDPKRVELSNFKGIPHLVGPVVSEVEKVIGALRWAVREMEERYRLFAEAGSRNIRGYNRKAGDKLPYIVVIVDELADLMMAAPEEVERLLCRIAQMARATGIHLVVATQRPSVDVVTGLIKANFPTRVSFAVASGTDSRVILDMVGAEKLLGRGDMLYMSSESSKVVRLQGCYVSDAELGRLVRFWKGRPVAKTEAGEPVKTWDRVELGEEGDDLLEEAKELIRERGEASVSLLQRRMRIGYPRAARLMDELEKEGLVGPARAGGKTREVLPDEDAEQKPPE